MPPWLCDDIVTCDNFEYMVRSPASARLLLAVPADALFAADMFHRPRSLTRPDPTRSTGDLDVRHDRRPGLARGAPAG